MLDNQYQCIRLAKEIPCTLALGAYLKNTICLTQNDKAYISPIIGDLNSRTNIERFHQTLDHMLSTFPIKPMMVAHDLHPDFYTTHYATEFGLASFAVQHHHAHIAAVAAEHQFTGAAIGLALDGYGYGSDGTAWGGELFLYENHSLLRLGSFKPIPQPGGDIATKEVWRMAASVLHCLKRDNEIEKRFSQHKQSRYISELINKKINSPLTSSCGRLFDAVSALLGIKEVTQHEAEAAIALEQHACKPTVDSKGWSIENGNLNLLPLVEKLLECNRTEGANLFHGTLSAALSEWVYLAAEQKKITSVIFSGGCFFNKILLKQLTESLKQKKLQLILPKRLSPGDPNISLGQAWLIGTKK